MAFNTTLKHFTSSQELATIWATGQNYLLNQLVLENDVIYRCAIAHTSGASFAADLGAGKWVAVSAAGASGSKNYIENGDFEDNNTTGWGLFNTTINSTTKIPTGSVVAGAAGFNALSVSGSSPLAGSYSLSVSTPAGVTITTTGFGFISDAFTIDREDQAKVMGFSFYYEAVSGTMNFSGTSSNTFAVYIRDVSGGEWIQPAGVYNLVQSSGVGLCSGTFQTTASGTQYQIAVLMINTVSAGVSMRFDDFQLGPQITVQGAAISDWVSARTVPALIGTTTNPTLNSSAVKYRRIGDSYEIAWYYSIATAGSGTYRFQMPDGLIIDTSKISHPYATNTGAGRFYDSSTLISYNLASRIELNSTTYITLTADGATGGAIGSSIPVAVGANDEIWASVILPVAGLSSNTVLSQDTDTRVVAAKAESSTSTAWPTADTILNYGTVSYDTHASITTGASWSYRIPVSGYYKISAAHLGSSSGATTLILRIRKNATVFAIGTFPMNAATSNIVVRVDGQNYFNAGDTFDIVAASSAATGTLVSGSTANTVFVERLSGPATIAASETVTARYSNSSGQAGLTDLAETTITGWTRTFDSHSFFNPTTGIATIPTSGTYLIQGQYLLTSAANLINREIEIRAQQAGSATQVLIIGPVGTQAAGTYAIFGQGAGIIKCNAGDTLTIKIFQSTGVSRQLDSNGNFNWISFTRIGN